ncbi:dienelactone hydrolase family protein [Streptomyces justiciae]|uniref:dienelactone hydrolase family protein n=1 Tax=Streptomyces justiciae TaxID=2780140 RepID=UPI0021187E70|nr:dienelactone hydrolase family protein [Streptomyces justiciae]MCW8379736.1 dienelactone hydrolase family protein [Streptomyces justiciae]
MSTVSVPIGDATMDAYVAEPRAESGPAVIVCQELFGVTPWLRSVCDRLAAAGYLAIAPDLFWRTERGLSLSEHDDNELAKAHEMAETYDRELGMSDLVAAVELARKLPKSNGKVAVLGFSLGGHLAFLSGCRNLADAAVCFCPTFVVPVLEEAKDLSTPMLVNIAGSDALCGAEDQTVIKAALAVCPTAEVRTAFGGGHAYARVGGRGYNQPAAELTWHAVMDFLARTFRTESPNRLAVRRFLRVFASGDVSELDEILAPDFHNTEAWHQPVAARADGREGMRNTLRWLRDGFADLRLEIIDIAEDGDTVALRVLFTGRQVGEYRGIPGTGKYIERKQAHFLKLRDGRITQQHAVRDDLSVLIELGAVDGTVWSVYS